MNVDTVLVIGCLFISTLVKDTHSDKATLWIIELLTSQLKIKLISECQLVKLEQK